MKSIQGCLTGTVAAATVLTAGISPAAQMAFTLGLLQTMIAVGNSLGPLVGGILADLAGYRVAFFCTGVTLALSGLVVLKWVDKDKRPAADTAQKKITLLPDIKPIKSSPMLITMMLVTFGLHAGSNVTAPMLPLFLKSLISTVSEGPSYVGSSTGIVLGVGAACTALAAVIVGKYSSRLGYWPTLIFCLCAAAVFTIPQTFVTNVYQLTVFRAISCFFIGGATPVINAIIAVTADKQYQGTVYGVNSSISSAGNALGPMIGSAAAMLSYRVMFLASALIFGLAAWQVSRRRKVNGA